MHRTLEEAKRLFFIETPSPKLIDGIRCEFLICTAPIFDELPVGWTEFGASRFLGANLAAWCPNHSTNACYELHERLLASAEVAANFTSGMEASDGD